MLVVGYSLEQTLGYGGSIEVYIRNKTYGDWTLIRTITDDTLNYAKIYENEISSDDAVFNELEFKFVLNADDTQEFSPILYEATLMYEDNLKS